MRAIFKLLLSFWLEILIGLVILLLSPTKWFLFYFFISFLVIVTKLYDHLRKLIRVYQVYNELKLIAIIRKLKITDDELSIVTDSAKKDMGKEKWDEIQKELEELCKSK